MTAFIITAIILLKIILPPVGSEDRDMATQLLKSAYAMAGAGGLVSAADMLEEAVKCDPALRATHESRIRLWRMGVAM